MTTPRFMRCQLGVLDTETDQVAYFDPTTITYAVDCLTNRPAFAEDLVWSPATAEDVESAREMHEKDQGNDG